MKDQMNLVTRPVAELEGPALRHAMAEAVGLLEELRWGVSEIEGLGLCMWTDNHGCWAPDEDWEITGPLIEKHNLSIDRPHQMRGCAVIGFHDWHAVHPKNYGGLIRYSGRGKTPLIAACRAIVAAQLGDTVQIPEELSWTT